MHSPTNLAALDSIQWGRLQQAISQLEEEWQQGRPVDLERLLPSVGDSLRPLFLQELIKSDIEIRWRHSKHTLLEEYVKDFPELGGVRKLPPALVYAEYRARSLAGDRPSAASYEGRFPVQFPEVNRMIHEEAAAEEAAATPATLSKPSTPPGSGKVLPLLHGYRLIRQIGKGQYGKVHEAEAPGGVLVAVKDICRSLDHEESQQELKALEEIKNLRHPHLLRTQAYWSTEDHLYIVTELADCSLHDRLKECRKQGLSGIPPKELVEYTMQTAEALDFLHEKGVHHRDVKPANILLVQRSALLADFGLARLLDRNEGVGVTQGWRGTPAYMSPESWRNRVTIHSDQYSLAATYVELRLGQFLFPSKDTVEAMDAHLTKQPDLGPLEGPEAEVLLKALSKDYTQRYPCCADFARALEAALANADSRTSKDLIRVMGFLPHRPLGGGNRGEIWEAVGVDGSHVALTYVNSLRLNPALQALEDVKLFKSFDHPHLVKVHSCGVFGGDGRQIKNEAAAKADASDRVSLRLATEMPTQDLARLLDRRLEQTGKPIPPEELLAYLKQAAEALDFLNSPRHRQGETRVAVRHCAVTPENLMLFDQTVKLGEYTLAQVVEGSPAPLRAPDVADNLNPRYAAPELFNDLVTDTSDEYALALVYYQLRTGGLPFDVSKSSYVIIQERLGGRLEFAKVPGPEWRVLARATAIQPAKRYPTCMDLISALEQAVAGIDVEPEPEVVAVVKAPASLRRSEAAAPSTNHPRAADHAPPASAPLSENAPLSDPLSQSTNVDINLDGTLRNAPEPLPASPTINERPSVRPPETARPKSDPQTVRPKSDPQTLPPKSDPGETAKPIVRKWQTDQVKTAKTVKRTPADTARQPAAMTPDKTTAVAPSAPVEKTERHPHALLALVAVVLVAAAAVVGYKVLRPDGAGTGPVVKDTGNGGEKPDPRKDDERKIVREPPPIPPDMFADVKQHLKNGDDLAKDPEQAIREYITALNGLNGLPENTELQQRIQSQLAAAYGVLLENGLHVVLAGDAQLGTPKNALDWITQALPANVRLDERNETAVCEALTDLAERPELFAQATDTLRSAPQLKGRSVPYVAFIEALAKNKTDLTAAANQLAGAFDGTSVPIVLQKQKRAERAVKLFENAANDLRQPDSLDKPFKEPLKDSANAAFRWLQKASLLGGKDQSAEATLALAAWYTSPQEKDTAQRMSKAALERKRRTPELDAGDAPLLLVYAASQNEDVDGRKTAVVAYADLARLLEKDRGASAKDRYQIVQKGLMAATQLDNRNLDATQQKKLAELHATRAKLLKEYPGEPWIDTNADAVKREVFVAYERAAALDAAKISYQVQRTYAHLKADSNWPLDDAAKEARALVKEYSDRYDCHQLLGYLLWTQSAHRGGPQRIESLTEAVKEYDVALSRSEQSDVPVSDIVLMRTYRGDACVLLANCDTSSREKQREWLYKAENDAKAVLRLNRDDYDGRLVLANAIEDIAWLLKETKRYEDAIHAFNEVFQVRPGDLKAYLSFGRCRCKWAEALSLVDPKREEVLQAARGNLQKVLDKEPESPEANYWFGEQYRLRAWSAASDARLRLYRDAFNSFVKAESCAAKEHMPHWAALALDMEADSALSEAEERFRQNLRDAQIDERLKAARQAIERLRPANEVWARDLEVRAFRDDGDKALLLGEDLYVRGKGQELATSIAALRSAAQELAQLGDAVAAARFRGTASKFDDKPQDALAAFDAGLAKARQQGVNLQTKAGLLLHLVRIKLLITPGIRPAGAADWPTSYVIAQQADEMLKLATDAIDADTRGKAAAAAAVAKYNAYTDAENTPEKEIPGLRDGSIRDIESALKLSPQRDGLRVLYGNLLLQRMQKETDPARIDSDAAKAIRELDAALKGSQLNPAERQGTRNLLEGIKQRQAEKGKGGS